MSTSRNIILIKYVWAPPSQWEVLKPNYVIYYFRPWTSCSIFHHLMLGLVIEEIAIKYRYIDMNFLYKFYPLICIIVKLKISYANFKMKPLIHIFSLWWYYSLLLSNHTVVGNGAIYCHLSVVANCVRHTISIFNIIVIRSVIIIFYETRLLVSTQSFLNL